MAKTLEVTHDTKSTSTGVSHSLSGSPITLGLEKHSQSINWSKAGKLEGNSLLLSTVAL